MGGESLRRKRLKKAYIEADNNNSNYYCYIIIDETNCSVCILLLSTNLPSSILPTPQESAYATNSL
jgi:hypothetical protein